MSKGRAGKPTFPRPLESYLKLCKIQHDFSVDLSIPFQQKEVNIIDPRWGIINLQMHHLSLTEKSLSCLKERHVIVLIQKKKNSSSHNISVCMDNRFRPIQVILLFLGFLFGLPYVTHFLIIYLIRECPHAILELADCAIRSNFQIILPPPPLPLGFPMLIYTHS